MKELFVEAHGTWFHVRHRGSEPLETCAITLYSSLHLLDCSSDGYLHTALIFLFFLYNGCRLGSIFSLFRKSTETQMQKCTHQMIQTVFQLISWTGFMGRNLTSINVYFVIHPPWQRGTFRVHPLMCGYLIPPLTGIAAVLISNGSHLHIVQFLSPHPPLLIHDPWCNQKKMIEVGLWKKGLHLHNLELM